MEITINGTIEKVPINTLDELVKLKELPRLGLVVELNGEIIREDMWANTKLKLGDVIELLNFVGGG